VLRNIVPDIRLQYAILRKNEESQEYISTVTRIPTTASDILNRLPFGVYPAQAVL
jgi:hypothetical protein